MIQPYPFFGFPNFRRHYNYPIRPNYMNSMKPSLPQNSKDNSMDYSKKFPNNNVKNSSANSCFPSQEHNSQDSNLNCENMDTDEVFDFFGIKLASDDLLILVLLFFLYKEEVKDPYLYISLILLLLS